MCMVFCLHEYLCTMGVSNALRDQKRVLNPLGLELQMGVNHVGADN